MERFRAYEGSKPYAFISYAHMDSDRVYEIISALNNDGFRIWYDQGIEIARRYKAVINEHIEKCSAFVVFATRNGIKREEVIDECAYAIALRKKMNIVYLEDIPAGELDAALRATFAINQRVMWGELADWERKYKLREALEECGGEHKAQPVMVSVETAKPAPAAATVTAAPTAPKAAAVSSPLLERGFSLGKKGWGKLIAGTGLLLLAAVSAGIYIPVVFSNTMYSVYVTYFFGLLYQDCAGNILNNIFNMVGGTQSGSTMAVLGAIVFLVPLLFKVLPFTYAFASGLKTPTSKRVYKALNVIGVFVISALWTAAIALDAYWRILCGDNAIEFVVAQSLYGIIRDAAIMAAGNAAVSNCFGNQVLGRTTAVRSRNNGIASLIAVGVAFALAYASGHGFAAGAVIFISVMLSRLLSFPWLALFLMNIAIDNAPGTFDLKKNKRISGTVTVISVILIIIAWLISVTFTFKQI